MEKALDTPSNVMIYKQHWDYYARTPGLLDKLRQTSRCSTTCCSTSDKTSGTWWRTWRHSWCFRMFRQQLSRFTPCYCLTPGEEGHHGQGKLCPALLLGKAGAAAQAEGSGGGQRPCRTPAAAQIESQAGGEIQTSSHRDNESVSGD